MAKSKEKKSTGKATNKPVRITEDVKWKVDNAVDTLIRAEEIKKDKGLMPKVKKAIVKKQKALKTVLKKTK